LTKIGVISAGFTNSERKLGIHQLLCHDGINWRSGEVGDALNSTIFKKNRLKNFWTQYVS